MHCLLGVHNYTGSGYVEYNGMIISNFAVVLILSPKSNHKKSTYQAICLFRSYIHKKTPFDLRGYSLLDGGIQLNIGAYEGQYPCAPSPNTSFYTTSVGAQIAIRFSVKSFTSMTESGNW